MTKYGFWKQSRSLENELIIYANIIVKKLPNFQKVLLSLHKMEYRFIDLVHG